MSRCQCNATVPNWTPQVSAKDVVEAVCVYCDGGLALRRLIRDRVLFRCPCPGCDRPIPIELDKLYRLQGFCRHCNGRILGTRLILNILWLAGGSAVVGEGSLSLPKITELLIQTQEM